MCLGEGQRMRTSDPAVREQVLSKLFPTLHCVQVIYLPCPSPQTLCILICATLGCTPQTAHLAFSSPLALLPRLLRGCGLLQAYLLRAMMEYCIYPPAPSETRKVLHTQTMMDCFTYFLSEKSKFSSFLHSCCSNSKSCQPPTPIPLPFS